MNALRLTAAGVLVLAALGAVRAAEKPDEKKALLVGVWEVTRATPEGFITPVGALHEFTREGGLKVRPRTEGKEGTVYEGTYTFDGDKLTLSLKNDKKPRDPATIRKLNEKELVLEISPGEVVEFRRRK